MDEISDSVSASEDRRSVAGSSTLPAAVDVAIIGAGHNGLVSACYLAKAGLRVGVVEANERPGGMTASGPFIAAAPGHTINSCAVDIIAMLHSQVLGDLELKQHGLKIIKPDPSYISLHTDGGTLALWRDPRRTAAEIEKFSKPDARAFLEFMELLDRVITTALPIMGTDTARPSAKVVWNTARESIKNRRQMSDILALLTGSASGALDERFEHPIVKGALLCLAAGTGPVDEPGSGLGFMMLALLSRVGCGRPIGGMQSLTDALVARLAAGRGTLVTGTPVSEILHSGGRARGIRLADGRVVTARAVVSAADPWITLRTLVGGDAVDRKTAARIDHSAANRLGTGVFKIDMALSEQIAAVSHEREDGVDLRIPTLLLGTEESVRGSFTSASRGDLPADPALMFSVPSGADPTQAPAGQDSAYIYNLAVPVDPRGGWDANREDAVTATLGKLAKYVQPIEQAEIGRIVETPQDIGERLHVRNGCITHIDMGMFNSGPLRPAIGLGFGKTPLDGLFLGGSAMHPGGGVSGLPGRTAAQRVARYLRKEG